VTIINAQDKFLRAQRLHLAEKFAEYDCNNIQSKDILIETHETLIAINNQYAPLNFTTQRYMIIDEEE